MGHWFQPNYFAPYECVVVTFHNTDEFHRHCMKPDSNDDISCMELDLYKVQVQVKLIHSKKQQTTTTMVT